MCGRFSLQTPAPLVAQTFDATLLESWEPSESFVPGRLIPILRMEGERLVAKTAVWGLMPSWAKDRALARHTFNARAETVAEKPAFRDAFAKRRCLIPADCFFEWHRRTDPSRHPAGSPWRFTVGKGALFVMAGLWETWVDPALGRAIETCTIITTVANWLLPFAEGTQGGNPCESPLGRVRITALHDRMPVILTEDAYAAWLGDSLQPKELSRFLAPLEPGRMECEPPSSSEGPIELDLG